MTFRSISNNLSNVMSSPSFISFKYLLICFQGYEDGFSMHTNRQRAHLKTSEKTKKTTLATESWEDKNGSI